ncbi:MAG: hypothetical protein CM15mP85_18640 [Rhodobacterales bacterium]|nr:MAG: hypothetical protein CM15mP85_18640 [Rhodobacterales bacterium]
MFLPGEFTEGENRSMQKISIWPQSNIDRDLILGSALFGVGWGLAGLCPGPAIASLSFGGSQSALFVLAMLLGMRLTPQIRSQISSSSAT